jgi:hypothetical protein
MRRMTIMTLAAGVTIACFGLQDDAQAQVSADINLHIGKRPPPEVVFEREPEVVLIPRSRVYCVSGLDYDMFRFAGFWYINDGGYWYRSNAYRGPFLSVEFARVPHAITVVPARYHHHPFHPLGGPPGQMKKSRGGMRQHDREVVARDSDRGRDSDRQMKNGKGGKGGKRGGN